MNTKPEIKFKRNVAIFHPHYKALVAKYEAEGLGACIGTRPDPTGTSTTGDLLVFRGGFWAASNMACRELVKEDWPGVLAACPEWMRQPGAVEWRD